MGFELVGRVWTAESLGRELAGEKPPAWIRAVVLHHTQIPDLAMRPRGLTIQHIITIADWYHRPPDQGGLGWSSGPHFFLDEEQIFGMCDVRRRGVHARSFNASALGIEVLGNYDVEDPAAGRGLRCWRNAAALAGVLLGWLGRAPSPETVLFHRDDPCRQSRCWRFPGTSGPSGMGAGAYRCGNSCAPGVYPTRSSPPGCTPAPANSSGAIPGCRAAITSPPLPPSVHPAAPGPRWRSR